MYDKKKLSELVQKAQGDRTQREYAEECKINRTYISKMINMKLEKPPHPDLLKNIANNSNVEYKDLMAAAGYLEGIYYTEESKKKIKEAIKEDQALYDFWNFISKRDDLQLMFKQSKDLPPSAIKNIINIMMMIEKEEGSY